MHSKQLSILARRHANVLLEHSRKVLRAPEAVVDGNGGHRLASLGDSLATTLDPNALSIVVWRHPHFAGEETVEPTLAVTMLTSNILDAFVLVGNVIDLG